MIDRLGVALALIRDEYASLATEPRRPGDPQLGEGVRRCQQAINVLTAIQAVRVAQFAAREDVRSEDGTIGQRDFPVGHISPFASSVIGPELGLGSRAAEDRVGVAARIVSAMPQTLAAMAGGDLDWHRARVLAGELQDADEAVVDEVERRVFPAVLADSAAEARRRCRRVLGRVDAAALVERAARARDGRCLQRWQSEPGVAEWHAVLPTEQAATAWAAIDELARGYQREDVAHTGKRPTLEQARCDALLDLILGRATVTTRVVFAVPETFTIDGGGRRHAWPGRQGRGGRSHAVGPAVAGTATVAPGLVEVAGVGELPWSALGPLTTAYATRISLAGCDPDHGTLTGVATEVYRPSPSVVRFVQARDGHCRFPQCSAPARRCDADHVVAWPAGTTEPSNLMSLCRRHHRTKQQPGWRVAIDAGARVTWTNPLGRSFTTHPVDHLGVRGGDGGDPSTHSLPPPEDES
jgi:hypothetical protein